MTTTTVAGTLYPILQTSYADQPSDLAVVSVREASMLGIRVGTRVILEDFSPEERLRFYGTVTRIQSSAHAPGRLLVSVDIGNYDEPASGCWFLDDDSP